MSISFTEAERSEQVCHIVSNPLKKPLSGLTWEHQGTKVQRLAVSSLQKELMFLFFKKSVVASAQILNFVNIV